MKNTTTKHTQKELRAMYASEVEKAYPHDKGIQRYRKSRLAYFFEYKGQIYVISKPQIEKEFCFGYDYHFDAREKDRAEGLRDWVLTEEGFIYYNSIKTNTELSNLKEIRFALENGIECDYFISVSKDLGEKSDVFMDYSVNFSEWRYIYNDKGENEWGDKIVNDLEFVDLLIEGLEWTIEDFESRLKSYLKRYGTSKVKAWTYIVD